MSKIRRSFTPEERYTIVQEAIRDGHAETCRKYSLFPSLLRKWRLKYLSKGKEGLKDSYARVDPQLRALKSKGRPGFVKTYIHKARDPLVKEQITATADRSDGPQRSRRTGYCRFGGPIVS